MSSLLALLYLICNRSRCLVRSLICSQDLRNLHSTMYNDNLGSLQELSDMIITSIEDDSIWCWCIMYIFHFYSVKFNHRSVKVKANSVGSKLINGEKWHMEIARPLCTCGQPVDVTNRLVERSLDQNTKGISDRFFHQIMNSRNTCQGT